MRRLAVVLLLSGSLWGVSNQVIIRTLKNAGRAQPITISRVFAEGEIRNFAAPRIGGAIPSAWQCDRKTIWPDGSLRHALISFQASVSSKPLAVVFVNSENPCSAGAQAACEAAGLDQKGMLAFTGGRWSAALHAAASPQGRTAARGASARALLEAGKWRYWLRGPAVTQAIVEDTDATRAGDFGWKEKHVTWLAQRVVPTDMTIAVTDASDLAALHAPFRIQIDDETIVVASVSGNTLKVASRGADGSVPAPHAASYSPTWVYSSALTRLSDGLPGGSLTAEVEDASGIKAGDILAIDNEQVRVCAVDGKKLVFGSAAKMPCAQGDAAGRQYNGTSGVARAHGKYHFVRRAADADRWSDAPSDRFKSLHPMFVLTFYAGWPGVKQEFILENDWADRAQDQYYDVKLLNGAGESATAWSSPGIKQIPFTRWRKTFWDGTAPEPVNIDYNLAYMFEAKTLPYDPALNISQAALDAELKNPQETQAGKMPVWPDSNQCDPDTAGVNGYLNRPVASADGMVLRDMEAPGGRGEIGLFPRWQATYLYAMASKLKRAPEMYGAMVGQGECAAHVPLHYREYDGKRLFCAAGTSASEAGTSCTPADRTVSAFGKPLSVDARPTVVTLNRQNASGADVLEREVGPVSMSRYVISIGHNPSLAFLPYLITGDYYFLQELQYWASFDLANASQIPVTMKPSQNPNIHQRDTFRHADWGYLDMTNGLRGQAWSLRDLGYAALMSPDGTPEKQYLTKKLDTNIAILEGKYNVTNGSYYKDCYNAANPDGTFDCSYWTFGRQYKAMGAPNPLHFENVPSVYGGGNDTDPAYTYMYFQPFMQRYLQVVLGHLEQLGFREVAALRKTVVSSLVNQVTNPVVKNPAVVEAYMSPNTPCQPEGKPSLPNCSKQVYKPGDPMWFTSWQAWYDAFAAERKSNTALTRAGDLVGGYPILARAAAAFATDIVDGQASGKATWEWLNSHIPDKQHFADTPMWAFRPH
jgi:hypothetical protein